VLAAVAVLADGQEQLLALEMCGTIERGVEGFLDDLVERGLKAPLLCIVDGNAACGARSRWCGARRRCSDAAVHKLRNLVRKAPKHAREEIADDFTVIVYAASEGAAREAYGVFTSKWKSPLPWRRAQPRGSGRRAADDVPLPEAARGKTIRTSHRAAQRRIPPTVKTQGRCRARQRAHPALSLVATGQNQAAQA